MSTLLAEALREALESFPVSIQGDAKAILHRLQDSVQNEIFQYKAPAPNRAEYLKTLGRKKGRLRQELALLQSSQASASALKEKENAIADIEYEQKRWDLNSPEIGADGKEYHTWVNEEWLFTKNVQPPTVPMKPGRGKRVRSSLQAHITKHVEPAVAALREISVKPKVTKEQAQQAVITALEPIRTLTDRSSALRWTPKSKPRK
jgi:hypothetical protein